MREAVRRAVESGMPTVAECGGFLYLQREIADSEVYLETHPEMQKNMSFARRI